MSGHPNYAGAAAIAQLTTLGRVGTSAIINTQHYQLVGETTLSTANTSLDVLLADWDTNVRPSWLSAMPDDYRLDLLRGVVVALPGLAHLAAAPRERVPGATNGAGGSSAGALSDAAVVKVKTALGGKHHRGRMYLLVRAGSIGDGLLTSLGYIAQVNALITALGRYIGAGADTANHVLGVWQRPLHTGEQQWTVRVAGALTVRSNPTASGGEFTPATSLVLDGTARSQRRREVGVGS